MLTPTIKGGVFTDKIYAVQCGCHLFSVEAFDREVAEMNRLERLHSSCPAGSAKNPYSIKSSPNTTRKVGKYECRMMTKFTAILAAKLLEDISYILYWQS